MTASVTEKPTISGSSLLTIGGLLLLLTLAISAWAFLSGDWVAGIALTLYLPVAGLLVMIGRKGDRV
ncbi:hypothetical protein RH831_01725 [Halodesulfurarchaeum sp. HSR-GB]|uniref:hypothetical protein n=1 Tax=Halodesulfurarchaeum sp. HSR-GB TaxID=3074077 RepID=UPI00285C8392|nr:hypothetical protein [Halodesulfurarchaeum sp. HSR-GB]MDR5655903.1 hypothetical protein [Halodesulfurarchaeum sp. HSR-GB]